ncbi:unnamed protein product [Aphanomyces euteiches]
MEVHVERRFMEKSRRKKPGNVKVVENYLRQDVHCALLNCRLCREKPAPVVQLDPAKTIVVPDATALVAYVDLFSEDAFQANQVLLLQSVLDRALDIAATREANQLESWLSLEDDHGLLKNFAYFANKNASETYLPPQVYSSNGSVNVESAVQRDRRLVANAVTWFIDHATDRARFIVLSDDEWLAASIPPHPRVDVLCCEAFISQHCGGDADLHALREECATAFALRQASTTAQGFTKHEEDLEQCHKGLFEVSAHHPLEAFVSRSGGEPRIFIYGRDAMNRAIHGDTVAVKLLPEDEWLVPDSAMSLVHHVSEEPQKKHVVVDNPQARVPTGRVVGIVDRPSHIYVATILSTSVVPGDDYVLAVPMDIRIPKIRMRSQNASGLVDQRLTVVVDSWPADSFYPQGHYVQVLGPVGDLETEIQALLVQHAVHAYPFSEPALACLPDVADVPLDAIAPCDTTKRPHIPLTNDYVVSDDEIARRRDIRASHCVFSVDPPGCQDIDDAMSVQELPNGHYELGVHIADVSHFVLPDTPLDLEARHRATTVYLVDRRYDMLPVLLSGDLCSIHCARDRLAFSVFWELDADFNIVPGKTTFTKSILHSVAAMTYGQADRLLAGLSADDPAVANTVGPGTAGQPIDSKLQPRLRNDLTILRSIGRKLLNQRTLQGAVDLSKGGELKFSTDDDGELRVGTKAALEIHSTIAELMILANSTVAQRLVETFPQSAMLRRHVPPSGNRFDQLIELAASQGIHLDPSSNMTLQQSLNAVNVDADTLALLKSMATRAMSEAEYICASEATGQRLRFGHYGLGLEFYTHFTSPIRRYADLIVHRQLQESLVQDGVAAPAPIAAVKKVADIQLPASLTPSVLGIDHRPTVAAKEVVVATTPTTQFPTEVLVPMSHHMNRQNRHAKRVSRACEELFLALYFKSHVSVVNAVVTAVKQNGLLVYLPQFDVKAPVYLKDRDGDVHLHAEMIPPKLRSQLAPPKYGFAQSSAMHRLPGATLVYSKDRLVVQSAASSSSSPLASFVPLQEVQVQISCDFTSASVRLPELRLLLVRPEKGRDDDGATDWQAEVVADAKPDDSSVKVLAANMETLRLNGPSMYSLLSSTIEPSAKVSKAPPKELRVEKKAVGRVIFGGFQPVIDKKYTKLMTAHYENRSAELEEAMTIQRSAIRDVGDTRRYEAEALRRTEKLMSEKRHDRINRRNKANN